MDISLIEEAETIESKKTKTISITDEGICSLSNCSLILLHKAALRPLFVMKDKDSNVHLYPQKQMKKPDIILFQETDGSRQSARTIQEQLKNGQCNPKMLSTSIISLIEKEENPSIYQNVLLTRLAALEKNGYQHAVIVAKKKTLDKIAHCIDGKGINPNYEVPLYSYSDGKEVKDPNLINNSYVTHDMLDDWLMRALNKKTLTFPHKCHSALEIHQIRNKIFDRK